MIYHKQETAYTCGAAAMRMLLSEMGIKRTEQQVARLLKTNKVRGTWVKMFPQVAEHFKLTYKVVRGESVDELRKDLKDNIILTAYYIPEEKVDHYVIIKNITKDKIHYLDPWYGPDHEHTLTHFKKVWRTDSRYDDEKGWYLAVRRRT